jgi:hypothetical protein
LGLRLKYQTRTSKKGQTHPKRKTKTEKRKKYKSGTSWPILINPLSYFSKDMHPVFD